ncbi:MAG: hypothetical protein ACLRVU_09630 [Beduini sp.]|uniref:hypothetical protein n=1 Tax=Beduini sp. TaxID=1922300 RepID=UPI0039A0A60A
MEVTKKAFEEKANLYQSLLAVRNVFQDFGIDINIEIENEEGSKRTINALDIITAHVVSFINRGVEENANTTDKKEMV